MKQPKIKADVSNTKVSEAMMMPVATLSTGMALVSSGKATCVIDPQNLELKTPIQHKSYYQNCSAEQDGRVLLGVQQLPNVDMFFMELDSLFFS